MKTKLTEMFGIEYPIVQSGMQWLAVPQLAAAVCNAGGIGTINVTCWPTLDEFADALDEMNSLTNKPYIVNISLAPTQRLDNEEIRKTIRLCGEKHVAAIETSAEDPREFIADIKSAGMRHFHKCPNYKVSMSMERKGLDGVIIAGYEVGGHPSADGVGTFVIARRCAADMKIPVIAAGGIADGHGLAAALALGASGVAMGRLILNASATKASHAGVPGSGITPVSVPLFSYTMYGRSALVIVTPFPSVPSKVQTPFPGLAVTAAGTSTCPFITSVEPQTLLHGPCQHTRIVSPFQMPDAVTFSP